MAVIFLHMLFFYAILKNMNINNIRKILKKGSLLQDEPMSKHTTFKVGGPARLYLIPGDEKEAAQLVRYFSLNGLPYYVIGNGSNLLVSDKGYEGAIIDLGRNDGTTFTMLGIDDEREGEVLFDCGAGCLLSSIGHYAAEFSAEGFEALAGIPGCVGGACIMNAGAFGSEMKDVIASVSVIDRSGQQKKLPLEELDFGYRSSSLMREGYIVTRAELLMKKGDKESIRQKMAELSEKRRSRQPLEFPSAGSTFKRPEGDFAGRLIEEAGLCGFSRGGAMVSEKHCGFVINRDNASAEDIYGLINEIIDRVHKKCGILLEPEVRMLGSF